MAVASAYDLKGKVAIVTGSSSGIGAAIALELARLGASVTLHGRNVESLKNVAKQLEEISNGKRKPLLVVGDVCQTDVRLKLINKTVDHFGRLDILINNAGYAVGNFLSSDLDTSRLDAMFDIHAKAPFHLMKLAVPHLEKTKGNVLNISTVGSLKPSAIWLEYGMAKAAMDYMTKCAAQELGPKGVRVNAINPGAIKTELLNRNTNVHDIKTEDFASFHALQRIGSADEISKVAGFLVSDGASFVTGVVLPVDGGILVGVMPSSK